MALPDMIKDLLGSGVHFGHLRKHWNPKMKKFIFGRKKNVYIIDLEKTAAKITEAKEFLKQLTANREKILFVATKKQLRDTVRELAQSCDMPYIVERWVGGFLTNYPTIRTRVRRYEQLLDQKEKGEFNKMPRKEVVRLNRDLERMDKNYKGVLCLDDIPACVFVVDPKREIACVREAKKLGLPIVAIIDTDADPDMIDYPVPGNDDAIRSVRYLVSCLVEAIKEGAVKAEELKTAAEQKPAEGSSEADSAAQETGSEQASAQADAQKPQTRDSEKKDKEN